MNGDVCIYSIITYIYYIYIYYIYRYMNMIFVSFTISLSSRRSRIVPSCGHPTLPTNTACISGASFSGSKPTQLGDHAPPRKNTSYALLSCQHQGKHIHSLLISFLCTDVFEAPLFSFPQSWHAKIRNGTQQNGYAQQPCLSGAGARYFYIKQQSNNNKQ